jgi:hypothetical protein
MNWARMLAYITGTVDQELLVRNEYLARADCFFRKLTSVWSRKSNGLKRRGLQPRLASWDCLLHRLDKAYNPASH